MVENKTKRAMDLVDLDFAPEDLFRVPSASVAGNAVETFIEEKEKEEKVMPSSEEESEMVNTETHLASVDRKLGQLSARVRPVDDPSGGFRGSRPRTDFEVAIKSQMQPMESYVWTDLGWINPALSWFHGKTNGQMAVRQGDLVFRPRGKESSHVLDTGHTTHFLGIALTSKGLMFAGQKINFPVALGGGMTTYNRSRAPLTPFATLNATMQSKCIEVLEGHNRSVGSLAHTERGPIVSLGWSVRGGPADVIVSY